MDVTSATQWAEEYIAETQRMLDLVPPQLPAVETALLEAFARDRTIFVIGNGGSAANATHFALDLSKSTINDAFAPKRFRAHALTDQTSLLTAVSNDIGYEMVFAQQLATFAREGDMLIAISGSGNSPNIVKAVDYARARGLVVVSLTGFDGGRLRAMADAGVHVPSNNMGLVEAVHGVIFHMIAEAMRVRVAEGAHAAL